MARITTLATPTAHLVGPGKLKLINGRLAFSSPAASPLRLDPRALREVYCYGSVSLSDEALRVLAAHRVELILLSRQGQRCRGRLVQLDTAATTLRLLQHRLLQHPAARLRLARQIVHQKVDSQIDAARHYQRQGRPAAGAVHRRLRDLQNRLANARTLDQLRGLEGSCSAAWFELFAQLLRPGSGFSRRQRRPPRDPVNALLSLGYTLLLNRLTARIQGRGLELNLGALHDYHPGRPSLACDLIEPLRLPLVDRWVLSRWNRKFFRPEQFVSDPQRGVLLGEDHFTRALTNWEKFLQNENRHQRIGQAVDQFCQQLRHLADTLPATTEGAC